MPSRRSPKQGASEPARTWPWRLKAHFDPRVTRIVERARAMHIFFRARLIRRPSRGQRNGIAGPIRTFPNSVLTQYRRRKQCQWPDDPGKQHIRPVARLRQKLNSRAKKGGFPSSMGPGPCGPKTSRDIEYAASRVNPEMTIAGHVRRCRNEDRMTSA